MKRLFFFISIVLFCFAFSGCPTVEPTIPTENEWVKVYVEIDLKKSSTQSENNALRYAVPSAFEEANDRNFIFAGVIYNSADNGTFSDSDLVKFDSENNGHSISLKKSSEDRTNYTLEIYAYESDYNAGFSKSAALFSGTTKITIPADVTSVDAGKVSLVPSPTSNEKGSAELSIKIPSGYVLVCDDTSNFEIAGNDNTGKYTLSSKSGGISKGTYTVNFSIRKTEADSLSAIYAWTETIHIYPGMKTDFWSSGIADADGAIDLSSISPNSTVFVRGASGGNWFTDNNIAADAGNNNTGNGSIAKPFATVQKALEKIIAINDWNTEFTVFVDGVVTASNDGSVANFSSIGSNPAKISIKGLGPASNKATLKGNLKNSVIIIPENSSLNLTLDNLKITEGSSTSGGAGIRIGSGTITIKDCEISSNTASGGNGGGIYNAGGTALLTDCTISGNRATNGGGIYNAGGTVEIIGGGIKTNNANFGVGFFNANGCVLKLSGAVKFDNTDDIYLDGSSYITIAGSLSETTVARITTAITLGKQVLGVDGTNVTKITSDICNKFTLSDESGTQSCIVPDDIGTWGIISKSIIDIPIVPAGEYTFRLVKNDEEIANGTPFSKDDELAFAVYNGTTKVTNAEKFKIAVKQNGEEIPGLTKESTASNDAKVTIPQKLVDTNREVDVVVSVTINGVTYDDTLKIKLSKEEAKVLSVDDLTSYLSGHTGKEEISVSVSSAADIEKIKTALKDSNITGVDLVIIGNIDSIGDLVFTGCDKLMSITLPDSVTSIGSLAFWGCTELTAVTLPANLKSIGDNAFTGCTELKEITIPNGVTSIGNSAFSNCTELKEITIPSGVTSIGNYAFYNCTGLTKITLSENLTSIGNSAFCDCKSLTTITIPNKVTSIGRNAFENCRSLTSVVFEDQVSEWYAADYTGPNIKPINVNDTTVNANNLRYDWCNNFLRKKTTP